MLLDDFFPFVLPEVPDCPDPLVRQALVSVAQEFCRKTTAWTDPIDPITLINDEPSYELDMPTDALVCNVRDVWLGSRKLRPITIDALQAELPNWTTATANEPIFYNMVDTRGTLRVYPIPANLNGQTLVVRAAFMPVSGAGSLPDFLGQFHMDAIASGAKARLMAMPATNEITWSNPALAAYHLSIFNLAVDTARIGEAHDRVQGLTTVMPRRFGF